MIGKWKGPWIKVKFYILSGGPHFQYKTIALVVMSQQKVLKVQEVWLWNKIENLRILY